MGHSFIPDDEIQRLNALLRYKILDTPPEEAFDRITRLAARLLSVPIAIISLVDANRIWFKSAFGLSDITEVSRNEGLCSSAILSDQPLIISDASHDIRARDIPLFRGDSGLRFYAAVPLCTKDGMKIGTLCVADSRPRHVGPAEIATLRELAAIVMDEFELRFASIQAVELETKLYQRISEQTQWLHQISHERQHAEQALRESEQRYHALIELSSDWHWEQDGHCRFTRIAAASGMEPAVAVRDYAGKTFRNLFGRQMDDDASWAPLEAALSSKQAFHEATFRWQDQSGALQYAEVSAQPIFSAEGLFQGYRGITRDVTDRMEAREKLEQSNAALRQLSVALQTFREVERKRIAKELHEDLAQMLATSRIELCMLQQDLVPTKSFHQRFSSLDQLIGSSIVTLRRIATELRPSSLDEGGLYFALQSLLKKFSNSHGIACTFMANESDLVLDEACSTGIFRIIQEALKNIGMHAEAKQVLVQLQRSNDGQLQILVQDDGKGIAESDMQKDKSFGLLDMRERVWELRGKINISGKPLQGSRIEIELPILNAAAVEL